MAIVAKRKNYQHVKQSEPSLSNLIIPTEFHPHGRIQIDPKTGMSRMPQRNVLLVDKVKRGGRELSKEINGGHAKADNSVWRLALAGPTRYFWKFMRDELHYRLRGGRAFSAPLLTDEEMLEARQFVSFLLTMKGDNKEVLPADFLNKKYDTGMRPLFEKIDGQFYAWLNKQDKTKLSALPKVTDIFIFLPA